LLLGNRLALLLNL